MSLSRALFTSTSPSWATPDALYRQLDAEFHFAPDAMSGETPTALTPWQKMIVDTGRGAPDGTIDECSIPPGGCIAVPLRRKADNTIYAFRCEACEQAWKVYQNATCGRRCQ